VNPGIDLCDERIHHLYDVEDGVIKPPLDFEEDVGHVDEARLMRACNLFSIMFVMTLCALCGFGTF